MFNFRALRGYPAVIGVLFGSVLLVRLTAQQPAAPDPVAARIDPYVEKQRVVVMTDIANEPDDQMSMVRFLVYCNQLRRRRADRDDVDVDEEQGAAGRHPDAGRRYEQVLPTAAAASAGISERPTRCKAVIVAGQPAYGMAAVGPDKIERRAPS